MDVGDLAMMGPKREAQPGLFYEFSLEDHVPQDHLLRSTKMGSNLPISALQHRRCLADDLPSLTAQACPSRSQRFGPSNSQNWQFIQPATVDNGLGRSADRLLIPLYEASRRNFPIMS